MTIADEKLLIKTLQGIEKQLETIDWQMMYKNNSDKKVPTNYLNKY